MSFTYDELIHFLLHAKRRTYAGQGDNASVAPLLLGSKQLEYREAPFFYRDIYFGMTSFVGQEVVYFRERPVWSLNYAGGVTPEITERDEVHAIYAFLQQTLQLVTYERPYRGPQRYQTNLYRYLDANQGDIIRFHGEEMIMSGGKRVYELRYSGGMLG
ncbi:MAG: DUF5680 domain-containing protein [Ktedonobacteraceae bacterium]